MLSAAALLDYAGKEIAQGLKMRLQYEAVLALVLWPTACFGQPERSAPYHIYGGMTYFSNSFNGLPNFRSHLLGWESAISFPAWRGLRFKVDVSGTTGENYGGFARARRPFVSQQNNFSIL